jgi:endonuclease-3
MSLTRWPLAEALSLLQRRFGKPSPPVATDPFEMVLGETCAYLVDDERRKEVFDRLKARTGGDPERLAAMRTEALAELIADGGMQPRMRAEKVQAAANLALDIGTAELKRLCKADPVRARRVLQKFPGIAEPGADRILMTAGKARTLGLESNGVRVLSRLGFGDAALRDYGKTYRSVSLAIEPELPGTTAARVQAHQLLRLHGRFICKTNAPRCVECPLAARCPVAR